jgi:hypothetical protein
VDACIIRRPNALSAGLEKVAMIAAQTNDASGIDHDPKRLTMRVSEPWKPAMKEKETPYPPSKSWTAYRIQTTDKRAIH